jgi:hypothetical protein
LARGEKRKNRPQGISITMAIAFNYKPQRLNLEEEGTYPATVD